MLIYSLLGSLILLVLKPSFFLEKLGFVEINNNTIDNGVLTLSESESYEIAQSLRANFIFHTFDKSVNDFVLIKTKEDLKKVAYKFGAISYSYGEYDLNDTAGTSFDLYDALRHYLNYYSHEMKQSTIVLIKETLKKDEYII